MNDEDKTATNDRAEIEARMGGTPDERLQRAVNEGLARSGALTSEPPPSTKDKKTRK